MKTILKHAPLKIFRWKTFAREPKHCLVCHILIAHSWLLLTDQFLTVAANELRSLTFAGRIVKAVAASKSSSSGTVRLRSLSIQNGTPKDASHRVDPREDVFFENLFQSVLDHETKLGMRHLTLLDLPLLQPAQWFRAIDTNFLTNVQIRHCQGAPLALTMLAEASASAPNLNCLSVIHCERNDGTGIEAGLASVLKSKFTFGALQLDICCREDFITPDLVTRHASTLKLFSYRTTPDHDDSSEVSCNISAISVIAQGCWLLQELAIPFPEHGILMDLRCDELTYFIEKMAGKESSLSGLQTLQFLSWPKSGEFDMPRALYEHLLQPIAAKLFDSHKLSQLSVIAFGGKDVSLDMDEQDVVIFVKGLQMTHFGQARSTAIQVTLQWLMHNYIGYSEDDCILHLDHGAISGPSIDDWRDSGDMPAPMDNTGKRGRWVRAAD